MDNNVGFNLGENFIERQPLGRDPTAMMNYAPGIQNDQAYGAPSTYQNAYNVDGVDVSGHAARHISAGADEIDGDQVDIDFTPTNYIPDTSPPEVTNVDHLSAHLAGIDTAILEAKTYGYGYADGSTISFLDLFDVDETSFVGNAGYSVVVNNDEDGLVFEQITATPARASGLVYAMLLMGG